MSVFLRIFPSVYFSVASARYSPREAADADGHHGSVEEKKEESGVSKFSGGTVQVLGVETEFAGIIRRHFLGQQAGLNTVCFLITIRFKERANRREYANKKEHPNGREHAIKKEHAIWKEHANLKEWGN